MKKTFLILFSYIYVLNTYSQATPNPSFENWTYVNGTITYQDPNSWNNYNSVTAPLSFVTCERTTNPPDVHLGISAIKLTNKLINNKRINIVATTGTINTLTNTVGGGIPFTLKPDSITGFYKYTYISGQSGYIDFLLLGSGGDTDTVGYARFTVPSSTNSTFNRFSKKINYKNNNPVVNSIWILSPSLDSIPNSKLIVDDIDLYPTSTGIASYQNIKIKVYPNPVSDNIIIENPLLSALNFDLYDALGRKIVSSEIKNIQNSINVSFLSDGIYYYTITDTNSDNFYTDKILLSK